MDDARIVDALETLAIKDNTKSVRDAASSALIELGRTPPLPQPPPSMRKIRDFFRERRGREFLVGLIGWYVINVPVWIIVIPFFPSVGYGFDWEMTDWLTPLVLVTNIAVLIVLAFKRGWSALGMLSAIVVNMLVSIAMGLWNNVMCGIPFFIHPNGF